MQKFIGKKVLISGAGKGIGKAIALEFGRVGAEVVFFDRDKKRVDEVKKELKNTGAKFISEVLDISDLSRLENFLKRIGKVDILINNVGVGLVKKFFDTTQKDLEEVFEINFYSPFFITQELAKKMKREDSIIFITSIHAQHPSLDPSYDASKAAINSLVSNLALELAPKGVRVNAVAPGHIDVSTRGQPRRQNDVPLGKRAGLPKDVAKACLFLSDSEQSKYITGVALPVAGGLHIPIAKDIEF